MRSDEAKPAAPDESPERRARRRRRRRILLAILALPALVLLLLAAVFLLRDGIARIALEQIGGAALGMELRVGRIHIATSGDIDVADVTASRPGESAPLRSLRVARIHLRCDWRRLASDGLAGVRSVEVDGLEAAVELDRAAPRDPAEPPADPWDWIEVVPRSRVQAHRIDVASRGMLFRLDALELAAEPRSSPPAEGERASAGARVEIRGRATALGIPSLDSIELAGLEAAVDLERPDPRRIDAAVARGDAWSWILALPRASVRVRRIDLVSDRGRAVVEPLTLDLGAPELGARLAAAGFVAIEHCSHEERGGFELRAAADSRGVREGALSLSTCLGRVRIDDLLLLPAADWSDSSIAAAGELRVDDLGELAEDLGIETSALAGPLSLDFTLEGPASWPDGEARLETSVPYCGGSAAVELRKAGDAVDLHATLCDLEARAGDASARAAETSIDLGWTGERPLVTASIRAGGLSIAAPPGSILSAAPLEGSLELELDWDGRAARLSGLALDLGPLSAVAAGAFALEGDIGRVLRREETPALGDIDLRLDAVALDFSLLSLLRPEVRRAEGRLHLEAALAGNALAPRWQATIFAEEGELRAGELPLVAGIAGEVHGAGAVVPPSAELWIDALRAEVAGAPVVVSGVARGFPAAPDAEVMVAGKDVLLARSDSFKLRADSDIVVSASGGDLLAAGDLRVTSGRILKVLPIVEYLGALPRRLRRGRLRRVAGQAQQRSAAFQLFSLQSPPLSLMRFDVAVAAQEPIEVRTNVGRGKLRPDLSLRGTGEAPYLVGALYLEDFVLFLPASRVVVESGALRFHESNPLFPELNLVGSARVRGYDITITVTGRVNEPTLTVSSTPPLPSDQLMVLVATGRLPAGGSQTTQQALFTVAKYVGMDLLRSIFGAEDIDSEESIFDRFDLDVGRNVSRTGRETWEARFRLKRNVVGDSDTLYLTGDRDEFDHYNLGLRIVFRGD